uniref:Competence protein ComEA n=1 Tax=Candidatus Kentrum sp. LFY TaxID=2126342 RepID=A0A450WI01_9GAMM|nr:MAG: competence protein ComEA [Candidatus Kentron sp. LFY]
MKIIKRLSIIKRLAFVFLLATPGLPWAGDAIDINTATRDELTAIKGIGPVIADRIVEERTKGLFCSLQGFADRVKGVGKKIIGSQSDNLTLGDVEKQCAEKP